jgi:hypothetical protein
MTMIGPIRGTIVVVGFAENEDVVTTTEWVFEDRHRAEVDVRVVTGRLVGGGAIEIPDSELTDVCYDALDSLGVMNELGYRDAEIARLTVVLDRRPPSPSIQTSDGDDEHT